MNSSRILLSCLLCAQFVSPSGPPSRSEIEGQFPETAGAARASELPSPVHSSAGMRLPSPTPAGGALATDAPSEDDDKFSFGRVVAVYAHSFVVREYDFARDRDVDVFYWVTSVTDLVNLPSLAQLAAGDDVVIDYLELAGERIVTTLVRELPDPRAGLQDAIGTVVAVEAGCVIVRPAQSDPAVGETVRYVVTGDTELNNLATVDELVPGDRVVLDYVEVAGLNGATSLARLPGSQNASGGRTEFECCLPCVVTSIDDSGAQFRVTNERLARVVTGCCELDPDVVRLNLTSLADIREGDRLDLVFSRVGGNWVVVGISRVTEP